MSQLAMCQRCCHDAPFGWSYCAGLGVSSTVALPLVLYFRDRSLQQGPQLLVIRRLVAVDSYLQLGAVSIWSPLASR